MRVPFEVWHINGHLVEFIEATHQYVVDGVVVPSITNILKVKFGNMYDFVSPEVLEKASNAGTAVHEAIENFERYGEESELPELRNYKFLKKAYGFECLKNEVPVILFDDDGKPLAVGRLDMVIRMNGRLGLADIKRTSVLNKDYVAYQLNLYRIAYQQCYGEQIDILQAIHLREDKRKFVAMPINTALAWDIVSEYYKNEKRKEKW